MGELRRIYKVRGLDAREGRKVVLATATQHARDRMAVRLRDEGYEVVVWEDDDAHALTALRSDATMRPRQA